MHDHGETVGGQAFGDGAADASGGAGDDRDARYGFGGAFQGVQPPAHLWTVRPLKM
jgi:hypothetical protein